MPSDPLREALERIVRLQARWDAPVIEDDVLTANQAWAAVGSEAHKIARVALAAAPVEPESATARWTLMSRRVSDGVGESEWVSVIDGPVLADGETIIVVRAGEPERVD